VQFRVSIAIGAILVLLGAGATVAAATTTRSPTRVTVVAPRFAQRGQVVRVNGRVTADSSIVAPALFRVSEAGSTVLRRVIRVHESRFRTWTRFSKPGVYRVSVSYPGDSSHLPSSATVNIRVTETFPWNPKGKAVVKSPDGVRLVIRSAFCSFGRHGGVRLRFGGKPVTTDKPYMQLVAQRRKGNPAVLDIFDGAFNFPPEWGDANHFGTVHVQVARRRGTFALFNEPDDVGRGKPRYTGTWNCG